MCRLNMCKNLRKGFIVFNTKPYCCLSKSQNVNFLMPFFGPFVYEMAAFVLRGSESLGNQCWPSNESKQGLEYCF